jgi:hypothetical protein
MEELNIHSWLDALFVDTGPQSIITSLSQWDPKICENIVAFLNKQPKHIRILIGIFSSHLLGKKNMNINKKEQENRTGALKVLTDTPNPQYNNSVCLREYFSNVLANPEKYMTEEVMCMFLNTFIVHIPSVRKSEEVNNKIQNYFRGLTQFLPLDDEKQLTEVECQIFSCIKRLHLYKAKFDEIEFSKVSDYVVLENKSNNLWFTYFLMVRGKHYNEIIKKITTISDSESDNRNFASKIYTFDIVKRTELELIEVIVDSDKSSAGKIWKVKYDNYIYAYKEFLYTDHEYADKHKLTGLIIKKEIPIYKALHKYDGFVSIYGLVNQNDDFKGILMEYLNSDWITLNKFCHKNVNLEDIHINCIGEYFLKAMKNLNTAGLSVSKIEHCENVMVNIKTYRVKFVAIDGISECQFKDKQTEENELCGIFDIDKKNSTSDKLLGYITGKYDDGYVGKTNSVYLQDTQEILDLQTKIKKKDINKFQVANEKQSQSRQEFIDNNQLFTGDKRYKIITDPKNAFLFFYPSSPIDTNSLMEQEINKWTTKDSVRSGWKKKFERILKKIQRP